MNAIRFISFTILANFANSFSSSSFPSSSSSLPMAVSIDDERPLYDPLKLYGANTKERKELRIRSLEPQLKVNKPVMDPLNLYPKKKKGGTAEEVDENVDMSDSLPFLTRPLTLKRELAGDVGFDPFNFANTEEKLLWQRKAELKHARIAMLAVSGWILSEVFDKQLADVFHLHPLLTDVGSRVPSIVNGDLDKINPLFWIIAIITTSYIEIRDIMNNNSNNKDNDIIDMWDPLGLYPSSSSDRKHIEVVEINNGRLAMLAFVGFTIQEFVTKTGVVSNLLTLVLPS